MESYHGGHRGEGESGLGKKFESATLLALRMEGTAMSPGLLVASQSWKSEEDEFSPELLEGTWPASTLM